MSFAPLVGATVALKKGVSINMRHNRTFSKEITANGGQKIFNDQSYLLSANYAQNISSNLRGSGLEQRSVSRDYLSYGQYLENGFPFVGWSLRFTGLERNKFPVSYTHLTLPTIYSV